MKIFQSHNPQRSEIPLAAKAIIVGLFAFVFMLIVLADLDLGPWFKSHVGNVPGLDKTLHFFVFGGLATPASFVFALFSTKLRLINVINGASAMLLVSTVEEFSQLWLSARTFDWNDLYCNYLGIACFGILTAILFVRNR